jgi:hypothetical protein
MHVGHPLSKGDEPTNTIMTPPANNARRPAILGNITPTALLPVTRLVHVTRHDLQKNHTGAVVDIRYRIRLVTTWGADAGYCRLTYNQMTWYQVKDVDQVITAYWRDHVIRPENARAVLSRHNISDFRFLWNHLPRSETAALHLLASYGLLGWWTSGMTEGQADAVVTAQVNIIDVDAIDALFDLDNIQSDGEHDDIADSIYDPGSD